MSDSLILSTKGARYRKTQDGPPSARVDPGHKPEMKMVATLFAAASVTMPMEASKAFDDIELAELILRQALRRRGFSFGEQHLENLTGFLLSDRNHRIVTDARLRPAARLYVHLSCMAHIALKHELHTSPRVLCDVRDRDILPVNAQLECYEADKWIAEWIGVQLPARVPNAVSPFLRGSRAVLRLRRDERGRTLRFLEGLGEFLWVHASWVYRPIRKTRFAQRNLARARRFFDKTRRSDRYWFMHADAAQS